MKFRSRLIRLGALIVLVASLVLPAPPAEALYLQTFTFTGGGWGHGLGMSQYGAKGLADRGSSATDILSHYYSGTAVADYSLPDRVRVGLTQNQTSISFVPTALVPGGGRADVFVPNQFLSAANAGETWTVTPTPDGHFNVLRNGALVKGSVGDQNTPVFVTYKGYGTLVKINQTGNRYRYDFLEISLHISDGYKLRVVNEISPFENYLYGIGEMPSSWASEALKAQAIAARTYAVEKIRRLGNFRPLCSCGVFASTADQAYVGYEKEVGASGQRWVDAVNTTHAPDNLSAKVILNAGQPIQALYHSSSGGYTENNEYVFGGSPLSYLRGVPDPTDAGSPNFRWQVSMSATELETKLNSRDSTRIGRLIDLEFLAPFGVSGRITPVVDTNHGGVRIVGSDRTVRVSGETFRSAVGLKSTLVQMGHLAYSAGFPGGVRVSSGDLDGDGVDDILTAPGPGGGPHIRALGLDGSEKSSFFAYSPEFGGGVFVAGTSRGHLPDSAVIATGAGEGGGPHVRILRLDGSEVAGWFAYPPSFPGGVRVALGNVDGTGPDELITGAGPGGGPHVRIFRVDPGAGSELAGFYAYPPGFPGGVSVAAGDVDGDGKAEVITGAGPGGGPHVRVLKVTAEGITEFAGFYAYPPGFGGGVWVAAGDVDGDGKAEVITGAGPGGGPHVRVFKITAEGVIEITGFYAYAADFTGGVFVTARRTGAASPRLEVVTGPGQGGSPVVRLFPIIGG